jgi:internalin A
MDEGEDDKPWKMPEYNLWKKSGYRIDDTVLRLYLKNVDSIPEEISNLTNLEELHINNSSLTSLPNSIENLKNLRVIYAEHTKLNSLPETIGNLTNLRLLHLNNSKLTSLPESIGKLKNVTVLSLSANHLTLLPDSIGNLTNLLYLYLDNNKLIKLPETIGKLKNLSELRINHNDFIYPIKINKNLSDRCKTEIEEINEHIRKTEPAKQGDRAMTLFKHLPKEIPNEVQNLMSQFSYGYNPPRNSNPPKHDNIIEKTKTNNASTKSKSSSCRGQFR